MFDIWCYVGMVFCFTSALGYFKWKCRTLEKTAKEYDLRIKSLQALLVQYSNAEAAKARTFVQEVDVILRDLAKYKPVDGILELSFPVEVKDDGKDCLRAYVSGDVMVNMRVSASTPLDSAACQSAQSHDQEA